MFYLRSHLPIHRKMPFMRTKTIKKWTCGKAYCSKCDVTWNLGIGIDTGPYTSAPFERDLGGLRVILGSMVLS